MNCCKIKSPQSDSTATLLANRKERSGAGNDKYRCKLPRLVQMHNTGCGDGNHAPQPQKLTETELLTLFRSGTEEKRGIEEVKYWENLVNQIAEDLKIIKDSVEKAVNDQARTQMEIDKCSNKDEKQCLLKLHSRQQQDLMECLKLEEKYFKDLQCAQRSMHESNLKKQSIGLKIIDDNVDKIYKLYETSKEHLYQHRSERECTHRATIQAYKRQAMKNFLETAMYKKLDAVQKNKNRKVLSMKDAMKKMRHHIRNTNHRHRKLKEEAITTFSMKQYAQKQALLNLKNSIDEKREELAEQVLAQKRRNDERERRKEIHRQKLLAEGENPFVVEELLRVQEKLQAQEMRALEFRKKAMKNVEKEIQQRERDYRKAILHRHKWDRFWAEKAREKRKQNYHQNILPYLATDKIKHSRADKWLRVAKETYGFEPGRKCEHPLLLDETEEEEGESENTGNEEETDLKPMKKGKRKKGSTSSKKSSGGSSKSSKKSVGSKNSKTSKKSEDSKHSKTSKKSEDSKHSNDSKASDVKAPDGKKESKKKKNKRTIIDKVGEILWEEEEEAEEEEQFNVEKEIHTLLPPRRTNPQDECVGHFPILDLGALLPPPKIQPQTSDQPIFAWSPKIISFKNYQPGKVYKLKVFVTNKSKQRLKYYFKGISIPEAEEIPKDITPPPKPESLPPDPVQKSSKTSTDTGRSKSSSRKKKKEDLKKPEAEQDSKVKDESTDHSKLPVPNSSKTSTDTNRSKSSSRKTKKKQQKSEVQPDVKVTDENLPPSPPKVNKASLTDYRLTDLIQIDFTVPSPISPGLQHSFRVTFTPKIQGNWTGQLNFTSELEAFSIPVEISKPEFTPKFEPISVSFHNTVVQTLMIKRVKIKNIGGLPGWISDVIEPNPPGNLNYAFETEVVPGPAVESSENLSTIASEMASSSKKAKRAKGKAGSKEKSNSKEKKRAKEKSSSKEKSGSKENIPGSKVEGSKESQAETIETIASSSKNTEKESNDKKSDSNRSGKRGSKSSSKDSSNKKDKSKKAQRRKTAKTADQVATKKPNPQSEIDVKAILDTIIASLVDKVFNYYVEEPSRKIDPGKEVTLCVLFRPPYVANFTTTFEINFDQVNAPGDQGTQGKSIEKKSILDVTGTTVDNPIYVQPMNGDFKICMINQAYQLSVKVHSTKGSGRVKAKVPLALKGLVDVYPNEQMTLTSTKYVDFSVKLTPKQWMLSDPQTLSGFFDPETNILDFPVFFHLQFPFKLPSPIKATFMAVISNCNFVVQPLELDLGICSTSETVKGQLSVHNPTVVTQILGFVDVPDEILVQPNYGFGKILPDETRIWDILLSPDRKSSEGSHVFNLRILTFAKEEITVKVKCDVKHNNASLSTNRILFPSTCCGSSVSTIVRIQPSKKQKGAGVLNFEVDLDPKFPISIIPSSGYLEPGRDMKLLVTFNANVTDEDVKASYVDFAQQQYHEKKSSYQRELASINMHLENDWMLEDNITPAVLEARTSTVFAKDDNPNVTSALEKIRSRKPTTPVPKEMQTEVVPDQKSNSAASSARSSKKHKKQRNSLDDNASTKSSSVGKPTKADKRSSSNRSRLQKKYNTSFEDNQEVLPWKQKVHRDLEKRKIYVMEQLAKPFEPPNIENISPQSMEFTRARRNFLKNLTPFSKTYEIPVFIQDSLSQEMTILTVVCPVQKPDIILLDDSSIFDFGSVVVGERSWREISLYNVSLGSLNLRMDVLDPYGPFIQSNAFRPLASEHVYSLKIRFEPMVADEFEESVNIYGGDSAVSITLKGVGIDKAQQVSNTVAATSSTSNLGRSLTSAGSKPGSSIISSIISSKTSSGKNSKKKKEKSKKKSAD